jgi:CHAD domain-containing protein
MRTRKQLVKYFRKHVDAVKELIKKTDEQLTAEDFHQLRVEIKKIRAFAAMLKASTRKFNPGKIIKPLKKIFDQAGKVRQVQLAEEALQRHDPNRTLQLFPRALRLKEEEEKNDFFVVKNGFKKEVKKTVSRIEPIIKKLSTQDIKKYIKDTKKEIIHLLSKKSLGAKQVHALRKGLKKLYYNLKSLKLIDKNIAFKNGKALQEVMGQWHDKRVITRDILRATRKQITAPAETEKILKIAYQLDAKSLQLYKEININKEKKMF